MKKIDKPDLVFDDVFNICVSSMRVPRKQNIENIKLILDVKNSDYDTKAKSSELYKIPSHDKVNNHVSKDDMVYLYDGKLLTNGRDFYNKLLTSAPHNICPFCSQRRVESLDHYLPKTKYPSFSITPINLVPCCSDCNKAKDTQSASRKSEQLIHPYYDDISEKFWLGAEVVECEPVVIKFYVIDFSLEDNVLYKRVLHQFTLLKLGKLYSSHAAEELENINEVITNLKKCCGLYAIIKYIEIQYDSYKNSHPNSWKTAMYRALLSSNWFQKL